MQCLLDMYIPSLLIVKVLIGVYFVVQQQRPIKKTLVKSGNFFLARFQFLDQVLIALVEAVWAVKSRLVELAPAAVAAACCAPAAQASCCAPEEKSDCCGSDGTSCGC